MADGMNNVNGVDHETEMKPEPVPVESTWQERHDATPKPTVLTKEDRLELENLQLKASNIQLQLTVMQADIQKAIAERDVVVKAMADKRQEVLEKYGVDIATVRVGPKGEFISNT